MMDFDKLRDQWRRAFSPMSTRELQTWISDFKQGLQSVPYLRLVKTTEGGFSSMVDFKCCLMQEGLNLSMVRADLERIWARGVATGAKTGYTFRETESGLKFYFSALTTSNNYITGVVNVTRKESL